MTDTPRRAYGRREPFTGEQVAQLRERFAAAGRVRDLAMLETALSSALRVSDLLRITTRDVLDASGAVRRELDVQMGKVSAARSHTVTVRLTGPAQAAVAALIAGQGKVVGDYVFTPRGRPHGAALTRKQFGRIVQGWAQELDLDAARYGSHSTRRTKLAHIYKASGNDLEAVRLIAGHRSITSTVSYLNVGVREALDLAERHAL